MDTLLIVEDEKMIRQGMKSIILKSQIPVGEIIECKNGVEALAIIKERSIDIMITDIRMPRMDGITLVKEIGTLPCKPKIVVVSGYDDFSYAVELLRNGAREYLLKPIERNKLIEALEKLDRELQEEKHQRNKDREREIKLEYKQLKYFLMEQSSEDELSEVALNIKKILNHKDYIVYCAKHKKRDNIEEEWMIYLEDVKGQDVFITSINKKQEMHTHILSEESFGESIAYQSIKELKQAYLEAVSDRKKVFLRGSMAEETSGDRRVKVDTLDQKAIVERITQFIGKENIDDVMNILKGFLYDIKHGKVDEIQFEQTMNHLLSQIAETYKNVIELNKEIGMPLKNIYQYDTVDEYFKEFTSYIELIHQKIIEEFDDYKNKYKMQQAVMYIKENYNKDLNMAVVSNYISMNYSLFSVAFKQYTGKNFVNYLKGMRINEAKRLLASTDKKIIEISATVGYENEKHFMKTFKSVCGVSPSEYRKNMQIGSQEHIYKAN